MTDTQKLDLILEKVTDLAERVTSLETDMKGVKQKVTEMDLIIENEIRVNIHRGIERHLDLSRRLSECMALSSKVQDKQVMQDIYINMHHAKLMTS